MVEVRVRDNGTFMYLEGLSKRTKKIGDEEAGKLAQFGVEALMQSAALAGIAPWRGNLFGPNGISVKRLAKHRYGIQIPMHGIFLDRMKPHYVSLKKGRLITQWATEKLGKRSGSIFVSPHPFIERGYKNMAKRANIVANRIANKIVRGKR